MCTLVLAALLTVLMTTGQLPDLATYLELLPLPQGDHKGPGGKEDGGGNVSVGSELLSLMAADFGLCFAIEKTVSFLFRY